MIKARTWTTVTWITILALSRDVSDLFQGWLKPACGSKESDSLHWTEMKRLTTSVKISQRTHRWPIPLLSIQSDMHTCLCCGLRCCTFTSCVLHTYKTDPYSVSLWQLLTEENKEWWRQGCWEWRRMTNITVYERLPMNHHEQINKIKNGKSESSIWIIHLRV